MVEEIKNELECPECKSHRLVLIGIDFNEGIYELSLICQDCFSQLALNLNTHIINLEVKEGVKKIKTKNVSPN